jgi:hypothetical protein
MRQTEAFSSSSYVHCAYDILTMYCDSGRDVKDKDIVIDEAHSELSHPREKTPNWRHSG